MKHENVAHDRTPEAFACARLEQVLEGLRESPMRIEPIWFYDERGSALFERICTTPEYYLTRTELAIMREHASDMAAALGPRIALIEPGSGASAKTRLLLEALENPRAYIPVDISREHLLCAAGRIRKDYPAIRVQPHCADFTQPISIPTLALDGASRRVVYFPGSTLGNFTRSAAIGFLARMREISGPGGAALIGIDRVKPESLLQRAYDDAAGVTAQFNINALRHLNRELGATFDLAAFEHRAHWVLAHSRIEMHLVANRDVTVAVGGERFAMARGDYLLTEYSHKYTLADAADIAGRAGFEVRRAWSDPRDWFSVLLLEPA